MGSVSLLRYERPKKLDPKELRGLEEATGFR
jgi:hypothetical protein